MAGPLLQEERCFIHSPESECGAPAGTRNQESHHAARLSPLRFLRKFHYSHLQDYRPSQEFCYSRTKAPGRGSVSPRFTEAPVNVEKNGSKARPLCLETGVILFLGVAFIVVAIGIVYTKPSGHKRFVYAERGDCSITNYWTTGIHLVINVLSIALLAVSNYVMQYLSAPSRADVGRAHMKRRWLDIGVFSARGYRR